MTALRSSAVTSWPEKNVGRSGLRSARHPWPAGDAHEHGLQPHLQEVAIGYVSSASSSTVQPASTSASARTAGTPSASRRSLKLSIVKIRPPGRGYRLQVTTAIGTAGNAAPAHGSVAPATGRHLSNRQSASRSL